MAVRGEEMTVTMPGSASWRTEAPTPGARASTLPPSGQTLLFGGAYELMELLGQGAMGEVWRARNVNLDKEVAIKVAKPEVADPSAHARLQNEARLIAKLSHPNVVGIYDTGVTSDGGYYLVMELLEGSDLRSVLDERQRLPAIEAVQIVLPVLAGLDCAHRRKILHRDIKPDNIFLARSEDQIVPKLVDFGVALAGDLPAEMRATRSGCLLGTPLYMAPEQIRGSAGWDERADIWAMTTVLYELIAGQAPFVDDDLTSLFSSIALREVPPLDEALCDAELSQILACGLAKDAVLRWSSAREMAGALVSWLAARGVTEDISGEPLGKAWRQGSSRAPADSMGAPAPVAAVTPAALGRSSSFVGALVSKRGRSLLLVVSFLVPSVFFLLTALGPARPSQVAPAAAGPVPAKPSSVRARSPLPAPAPARTGSVSSGEAAENRPPLRAASAVEPARGRDPAERAVSPPPTVAAERGTSSTPEGEQDRASAPAVPTPPPTESRPSVDPTWGF